jgi:nucleotide-binding universal stress UspA family protein
MRILVPIDFSEITKTVIFEAKSLAEKLMAKIWLIHIAEPDPFFVGYEPGPQSVRDNLAKKFRNEHVQLQEEAKKLRHTNIDATALLIQGPTVKTIITESEKLKIDMIIMGSHGHGAILKLIVGSVSEGVLKEASCPVLIIPGYNKTWHEIQNSQKV